MLTGAGFFEAVTFGFIAEAAAAPFAPAGDIVGDRQPAVGDLRGAAPVALPGLLDGIGHNRRREQRDVRLFEIGERVLARRRRTARRSRSPGPAPPTSPTGAAPPAAGHVLRPKGVVERVALALGVSTTVEPDTSAGWLVAGQSAAVVAGGDQRIGVLGRLTPATWPSGTGSRATMRCSSANIDLDAADAAADGAPTARRAAAPLPVGDPRHRAAGRRHAAGGDAAAHDSRAPRRRRWPHVREFDRYQGKGVPDGKVSLALRLTFRSPDRTLTDGEVQAAMDAVVAALLSTHGAVQR